MRRLRDNERCSIRCYEKTRKTLNPTKRSEFFHGTKRTRGEAYITAVNVEGEAPVKATSAPFNAHLIDLMLNINEATRSSGWAQHTCTYVYTGYTEKRN